MFKNYYYLWLLGFLLHCYLILTILRKTAAKQETLLNLLQSYSNITNKLKQNGGVFSYFKVTIA